jgi:cobaltochelatase CobS
MADIILSSEKLFERLVMAIKGKPEYQQRVVAHIRETHGHATLPSFHRNGATEQERIQTYGKCLGVIVRVERGERTAWSELKGQVAQGQAVSLAPEPKPEAAAPSRDSLAEARAEAEAPKVVERKVVQPSPLDTDNQDAGALITRALRMMGSSVNPEQVREIVKEELDKGPDMADALSNSLKIFEQSFSELRDGVNTKVDEFLAKVPPRDVVEIRTPDKPTKEIARQHYKFGLVMKVIGARLSCLLVGPAGTGKTTAPLKAAEALGLPVELIPIGPQTSKADILGYRDANGTYRDTATVRRAIEGGVIVWDEVDAGHAGVMTCGNALTANGHVDLPHGRFDKHKDFIMVACANTYGNGANRVYVGRNQLDAATLDRFVVIDWPTDEGLEAHIVGVKKPSPKFDIEEGGIVEPKDWVEYVANVRAACDKLAIRAVISPRATIHGCKLFAAGIGRTHVEEMVIWKGMEKATRDKITGAL